MILHGDEDERVDGKVGGGTDDGKRDTGRPGY